jgi:hypothetical protein
MPHGVKRPTPSLHIPRNAQSDRTVFLPQILFLILARVKLRQRRVRGRRPHHIILQ